jgi:hypothetical protein
MRAEADRLSAELARLARAANNRKVAGWLLALAADDGPSENGSGRSDQDRPAPQFQTTARRRSDVGHRFQSTA